MVNPVNYADLSDFVIRARGGYGDQDRQAALMQRLEKIKEMNSASHQRMMASYEAARAARNTGGGGGHDSHAGHAHGSGNPLEGSTRGGLNQSFQQALNRLFADAPGGVSIGSGYRSIAEQQVLYDRYRRGVRGQAPAAPPGRSRHNHGLAADLRYAAPSVRNWIHQNAARYGLWFPMSYEPWHIEPISTRRR